MTRTAIILAAGASSRMRTSNPPEEMSEDMVQMSTSRPKALIELDNSNRPVLDFLLSNMSDAGIQKVILVVGEENEAFRSFYGKEDCNNLFREINICYAVQPIPENRLKPLGTADAVLQALDQYPELKDEEFIVCNSDNLYSENAIRSLANSYSPNALIAYDRDALEFSDERISKFALMQLDESNQLVQIVEKPTVDDMPIYKDIKGKYRVSMNIFKFDGSLFYAFLKDCPMHPQRLEKELPTALMNMIESHKGVCNAIPLAEHVPDLTSKEDIQIFRDYLRNSSI